MMSEFLCRFSKFFMIFCVPLVSFEGSGLNVLGEEISSFFFVDDVGVDSVHLVLLDIVDFIDFIGFRGFVTIFGVDSLVLRARYLRLGVTWLMGRHVSIWAVFLLFGLS